MGKSMCLRLGCIFMPPPIGGGRHYVFVASWLCVCVAVWLCVCEAIFMRRDFSQTVRPILIKLGEWVGLCLPQTG